MLLRLLVLLLFSLFVLNLSLIEVQASEDNESPRVSLVAPVKGGNYGGSLEFSARASDGGGVEEVEFGYESSEVTLTWVSGVESSHGFWRASLDTDELPDGHYRLSVRSTDSSGNQRVLLGVTGIVVDNDPPEVLLTAPLEGNYSGSLEFSARASDGMSGVKSVRFGYRPSGSGRVNWFSARKKAGDILWTGLLDSQHLRNGSYSLSVSSTDFAGNKLLLSDVVEIVVGNDGNQSPNKSRVQTPSGGGGSLPDSTGSDKDSVPSSVVSDSDNESPAPKFDGIVDAVSGNDSEIEGESVEAGYDGVGAVEAGYDGIDFFEGGGVLYAAIAIFFVAVVCAVWFLLR